MSGGGAQKLARSDGEGSELDVLLRAAQDVVLLKLHANSHLHSLSATIATPNPPTLNPVIDLLDADLARHFDALRSHPSEPKPKRADDAPSAPFGGDDDGMDKLEARFVALKGVVGPEKETRVRPEKDARVSPEKRMMRKRKWNWRGRIANVDPDM
ncbi:hypothetical protein GUJ93_ZPchr0010g11242 [Zizania palustris]|uniref:Uncharacterized protein n=1 Tax=Zizania palustris TaxID=103762 RepID=A0A8J5W8L6_ZIZPA|nr:hypothetical protein GUJ93_ZPchr0010g11242 [Zizania palustris]